MVDWAYKNNFLPVVVVLLLFPSSSPAYGLHSYRGRLSYLVLGFVVFPHQLRAEWLELLVLLKVSVLFSALVWSLLSSALRINLPQKEPCFNKLMLRS